ncbi:HGF [Branchiostoma lanceolatum]|uniref:HGF protein n=1 Tax=Branchiostoma lanceolatum TaxID=7740 RepID=A0A8J9V916_BRALA|nr:HGF [Branchiostoma lanceolatum]
MYAFVGAPQFCNAAYRDQNALQRMTDVSVESLDKTGCTGKPHGSDYRGNISVTRSGKTCQRWDVDFPHHHYYGPEEYAELAENYCRNPGGIAPGLWCYITDPSTRWEYCINPTCPTGIVEMWRYDGRCGMSFPASEATPGECNPYSSKPCCSAYGWCGNGSIYCSCVNCVHYRAKK